MRIAFFDTVSGISGDMTLGACVDAGVSFDRLVEELKKLPLGGYRMEKRSVMRSSIQAVKIDVHVHEHESGTGAHQRAEAAKQEGASGTGAHQRATGATHDHDAHNHHSHHAHSHGGDHHEHVHEHEHENHRSYREIRELISTSTLSEKVQSTAQAMFLNLAKAEATVHGTNVEDVHFHEVGAVDSIIDIVGTAICMELLGVERVYSTPVRTGSGGTVRTQHGIMPVPAPATVELLKGYPVELTDIPYELATPTGATIIATLSSGVMDRSAPMRIESVGYGAGTKEFDALPNMLRLVIAEVDADMRDERLVLLETNIDDMNPELLPHVLERLLEAGARDAWLTPVLMKKGRPAHVLAVLADETLRDELIGLLLDETSTTGVRLQSVTRRTLEREIIRVNTDFGEIAVKRIARAGGTVLVPEFEECRRIARERNLPLIDVYRRLESELPKSDPGPRETKHIPPQC